MGQLRGWWVQGGYEEGGDGVTACSHKQTLTRRQQNQLKIRGRC